MTTRRKLAALFIGLTVLGAAGCSDAAETQESVQTNEEAISGGWTTLVLRNGWQAYGGTTPAVGIVNGVVTFRGAIKAPASLNPVAFVLDDPKFQPSPLDGLYLRTVMSGNVGGTLFYSPYNDGQGNYHQVSIYQDGISPRGLGTAARTFVSLDGVAFDKSYGSAIDHDPSWTSRYQLREHGCPGGFSVNPCGAFVKLVDGFVRFQGLLGKIDTNDYNGFLFTLTDPQYIPGNIVTVPVNLGGGEGSFQSFGAITIYTDGSVFVNGNPPAAALNTSFEGVSYSKTLSNVNLPLSNSWHAFSARSVKVGKYGDVVRFQGAISGGTSATIGTLPTGYAPPKTVRLVAVANGPVPATIVINTLGVVTVEGPPLYVSAQFLSLDGVSFGR